MKHIIYSIGELSVAGGIGRIISLKANWLAEHGYDVTILTTEGTGENAFYSVHPKIKIVNFNINYLSVYNNKRNIIGIIKSLIDRIKKQNLHKKLLKEYLYTHPCDVLFTSSNIPFVNSFKDGSRKIYETHFSCEAQRQFIKDSPFIFGLCYSIYNKYHQSRLNGYDHVVILTDKDKFLRGNKKNFIVIPNFITAKPQSMIPDYNNKRAISVGRLEHVKGFDLLIKAWKTVYQRHPDWSLDIYGHSYGRIDDYNAMISDNGLDGIIHIHEAVRNIEEKYLESSFYIMSSRYEGFPLVLPEAMSCGLPCISYDINCGPADIIRDGEDGILVRPVESIPALSDAICKMIENPEMRETQGKKARKNIQRYSIDSVMQRWIELIER